jgi:hypothetical protein
MSFNIVLSDYGSILWYRVPAQNRKKFSRKHMPRYAAVCFSLSSPGADGRIVQDRKFNRMGYI